MGTSYWGHTKASDSKLALRKGNRMDMVVHTLNPSIQEADVYEFKVSLIYTVSLTSSRGTRWNVVSKKKKKKVRGSIINDLGEIQGFLGTVLFNLVVSVLQLRKSSSLQWLRCLSVHQSLIRLLISGDPWPTWWQALPLTLQFAACNILEGNGPQVCFPWLTSLGFFFSLWVQRLLISKMCSFIWPFPFLLRPQPRNTCSAR